MKLFSTACALLLMTSPAFADLRVVFSEGAPKDRFTITNAGACPIDNATITLDLAGSKSGLIFDVTGNGAGVEVFQPLEITTGQNTLRSIPKVRDGDNKVAFDVKRLREGESISFTIDVDDTMGGREITVSGAEIQAARVVYAAGATTRSGEFGKTARATVETGACS